MFPATSYDVEATAEEGRSAPAIPLIRAARKETRITAEVIAEGVEEGRAHT
ncbi:hypothetical protein STRTUCAR8_00558 [Streptomyces turgidiscabies Car8]|uniref:Uncharacterized protein n=1 Tax=Streptomyces turgidiscabies (strain Car8) TaxID=698760 RepID=L7EUP5_STRT8|nr:hypothetical protein STRTUCAR8_00558 [Streptomyces turgidiscabies Car8]